LGSLNSYFGLAENDYLYAKNGFDFCDQLGNYNNVTAGCSQAAEKYLKAILELLFTEDTDVLTLMKSHNLRAILNKLKEKLDFPVSSRDCKWLGDFYFDARYPGDNFLITTKEDAEEALSILEHIRKATSDILEKERRIRAEQRKSMQRLKAFEDIN
jgi:HEPN domain-containing protein